MAGLGEFLGPSRRSPSRCIPGGIRLSHHPGEVLSAFYFPSSLEQAWFFLLLFFWSLLYKDPNRGMGEEGGEGVARQAGKPEEQCGGGAGGEEPNQLSQW